MSGFVVLHRSEEVLALLENYPNAFLLLSQIGIRARWRDEQCPITGLKRGQALIGDWQKAGLGSQMKYRNAKEILKKAQFVTFKGTSKGTVATLTDKAPFSPSVKNITTKTTIEQRSSNDQATTKNKVTRKQIEFGKSQVIKIGGREFRP